jgi:hypothetical protein
VREHLDVEVGERQDGADLVALDELGEERDVAGVVDPRRCVAVGGGVLRRGQRVGVDGECCANALTMS